ncbi:MAG: hypothetical protein HC767_00060 [Akkermansiaceae bacterium]|nr:hypothetical protein [Akkermansiaceae bacterium]
MMNPAVVEGRKAISCNDLADPHHALGKRPHLKGLPIAYTQRVEKRCRNGTSRRAVPVSQVVDGCINVITDALHDCPQEDLAKWTAMMNTVFEDRGQVLTCARVAVFHRCMMHNFLVSSRLSSGTLAREGKSEASSYCLAHLTNRDGAKVTGPCFVKYFVLMEWGGGLPTSRVAAVCPVTFDTRDEERGAFGQTVFRFDPTVGRQSDIEFIHVDDIIRPFILIKPQADPGRCMWRLVQFQGKLLGSFDEEDYW